MTIWTRTRTRYEPKPRFDNREYDTALCKTCASVVIYTASFTPLCGKCGNTEVVKVPESQVKEYQATFRFFQGALQKMDDALSLHDAHQLANDTQTMEQPTLAEAVAGETERTLDWLGSRTDAEMVDYTADCGHRFGLDAYGVIDMDDAPNSSDEIPF